MDKLIVISAPSFIQNETEIWMQLLQAELFKLHIRKPEWNNEQVIKQIEKVPAEWRSKLVVHQHGNIAENLQLGGVHLSYSRLKKERKYNLPVSFSVHSWPEAEQVLEEAAYTFISPVCDSISKKGYQKNEALQTVPENLRHKKIYALSGINETNIKQVMSNGYYGVCLLGCLWQQPEKALKQFEKIKQRIYSYEF